jgi:FtsH-binding integral membrane protein
MAALGLFFAYAALNGLTFGLIFTVYTLPSVGAAFFSAAAMFGGAALYGAVTKRSLAGLGGVLTMALFGIIGASIVNLFLGWSTLSFLIALVGVVVFTALTAYHVQRIQSGQLALAVGSTEKAAVMGALLLYLDFVNLFLMLLRLFGSRR